MRVLSPTDQAIREAADALNRGELIGLPTETVYGIAAIATNQEAVLKTFALKGRPADNPLIVHVAAMRQVENLVTGIPEFARRLGELFWPGPLTLVLHKLPSVPDEVTGGLNTVAVRVPGHPIARAIIEAANSPLSAPSANVFMGLSPTQAGHISPEILSGLTCVIDGGPCEIGLESTVVDCTGLAPVILRPGAITRDQIESVVGSVSHAVPSERRSPGTYSRHYAPQTPLRLVASLGSHDAGIVVSPPANPHQIQLPLDPTRYGAMLYTTLFNLDEFGFPEILIEMPPSTAAWEAVWDRIRKASG